jgi:hypothetical protein
MRSLASRCPRTHEGEAGLAQPYFDSRGVARGDGRVIDGRWEICRDGSNWGLDFRLTYTKSS